MNQEKIQQIEDETRDLFLNNPDENWNVFWHIHMKPVIEKSKELAEKYGADLEVVWLSAILHDFGQLESIENHDELGARKGLELLVEKGFNVEIAEKVRDVIFTHSANEHVPQTVEQKVLATADAMTHFTTPFYFWLVRVNDNPLEVTMKKIQEKIEKDFNKKILFEEERRIVEPQYLVLKSIFEMKI